MNLTKSLQKQNVWVFSHQIHITGNLIPVGVLINTENSKKTYKNQYENKNKITA